MHGSLFIHQHCNDLQKALLKEMDEAKEMNSEAKMEQSIPPYYPPGPWVGGRTKLSI